MLQIDPRTPVPARLALYRRIAQEGASSSLVQRCAARAIQAREPWERCAAILRATQDVTRYVPDPPGPDLVWSPQETLLAGGDCEDLAILGASIAHAAGVPFLIAWLDLSKDVAPQAHVSLLLWRGDGWAWAEACEDSAQLGEHPLDVAARLGPSSRRRFV